MISAAAAISAPTAVTKIASWRLCEDSAGSVQAMIEGGDCPAPMRSASPTDVTGGMMTRQARWP